MSKSLFKGKTGVPGWKSHPGLLHYVECDNLGRVLARAGGEHDELPTITNSFLQLGQMLGKSLGLEDCDEVMIVQPDREAFFTVNNGRHIGLEKKRD